MMPEQVKPGASLQDTAIPGQAFGLEYAQAFAHLFVQENGFFRGFKFGEELAAWLAASDVFVFPSRTDTFGIVLLEAMACGLPVAAFPVTGPFDVVKRGVTGVLDDNLKLAIEGALQLDPRDCIEYARGFSWKVSARDFLDYLAPLEAPGDASQVTMLSGS